MTAINLMNLAPACVKNNGDRREFAVCAYVGVERTKHDSAAYDKDSDVNAGDRHISVKASKFSLMSGSKCEGKTEFDAIWNLYSDKCHSNEWCYMTEDFTAYFMNKNEFKQFVYKFCTTQKESKKNGGHTKIRCREESDIMRKWLAAQVA
jgi:hypothetical protein